MDPAVFSLPCALPLRAQNAGLFISRGVGRHPARVIDSYELIFVRRGRLGMEEDGVPFDLQEGDALLLWPRRPHRGTAPYPADLRFYWIHFTLEPGDAADALRVPQRARAARPDRLTTLFRAFLDDQEAGVLTPASGAAFVLQLLLELTLPAPSRPAGGAAAVLVQRAHAHIAQHLAAPLSTAVLARALDCHPDYLGRVVMAVTGQTVTAAIHRERLRHARQLLLESDRPVSAIARACGFADAGYFRRLFVRHMGVTPLRYRRTFARMHVNTR